MPMCICQSAVKTKYRLWSRPIPNKVGQNCFRYILIDISNMLFTENAIIIKAILHAKILGTRESCIQVLKRKR